MKNVINQTDDIMKSIDIDDKIKVQILADKIKQLALSYDDLL